MKHQEFLKILQEVNERLRQLTASKGEEYKGQEDDQIGNFRRMAARTGLTMEQIWQVFFHKHVDAIDTFVRDKASGKERNRSEPVESRIDDAILYLVLLRAILRDQSPVNDHWLMTQALNPGQSLNPIPGPHNHALLIGFENSHYVIDAKQAEQTGRDAGFKSVTLISHPDHLHGVPSGSEFWWVGGECTLKEEFKLTCGQKGIEFFTWLKP